MIGSQTSIPGRESRERIFVVDKVNGMISDQFDFGENWKNYSASILDDKRLADARRALVDLFGKDRLHGCSFLDVGSGSGIVSVAAAQSGAREVVGIDINPKCIEVGERNANRFIRGRVDIRFEQGSVLDRDVMEKLGVFDIVYAWGSLHHTGDMYRAIGNVLPHVKSGGVLCLAIYKYHFTSPVWRVIKRFYNLSPKWLQKFWIGLFYPIIYIAKFLVTFRRPGKMERGMGFYYDVVDWLGGYPYEYATEKEIVDFVLPRGFRHIRTIPTKVPTGNQEYLFEKSN